MELRPFIAALALALPLGSLACDEDDTSLCTDAGCPDAISMVVAGANGAGLAEGEYTVTLTLDADSWSTSCSTAGAAACAPLEGPASSLSIGATSDGRIVVSVAEDPGQRPSMYAIRLDRGEETLLAATDAIEYQVEHPNGPDCGPVCESAPTLEFEVPQ